MNQTTEKLVRDFPTDVPGIARVVGFAGKVAYWMGWFMATGSDAKLAMTKAVMMSNAEDDKVSAIVELALHNELKAGHIRPSRKRVRLTVTVVPD